MRLTAPQDETVSTNAGASGRLHETHDAFARQNCAENRCIWLAMVSSVSPETEHTPAKAMTVSREWPATPVGSGGTRPRCLWAAAGHGPPYTSTPDAAGVEGAGGPGGHGRASRRGAERSEALASRAAGPEGTWNTSGAASNKLNREFRLRHWCGGRRRDRRARPRCPWVAAWSGCGARGRRWDPAAVPVGGGGARLGFETTRRATYQRPGAAGVEGAGGTGGHGRASRRGAERSEAA